MLYQKAEIKNTFLKRTEESFKNAKNQFAGLYKDFLNKSLASTLIDAKDSILYLKNGLLSDLKNSLMLKIVDLISNNYSNYLQFLTDKLIDLIPIIDKPPTVIIIFNNKDYENFKNSPSKVTSLFKNEVIINKSKDEFIGGFKIISKGGSFQYNYSIDALLEKNIIIVEKFLSNIFSEEKVQELQRNFEKFIENKKLEIKDYLIEHEQI